MILNRLKAAGQVRLAAEERIAFTKRVFPGDIEAQKLGVSDARDLYTVADLIQSGKFTKAYEKLNSLDTSVRDEIPEVVYKFLDKKTRSGDHPFGVIGKNRYNENRTTNKEHTFKELCAVILNAPEYKKEIKQINEARVVTKRRAIQLLRKAAKNQVEFAATHWPDDRDMIQLSKTDAKKLNDAADLISGGNFNDAYSKLERLDTAVREEVPIEVFNFLERNTKSDGFQESKIKEQKEKIEAGQISSMECDNKCQDGEVSVTGHTEKTCNKCEKKTTVEEQKIEDVKLKSIEKDLSDKENIAKNSPKLKVEAATSERFETGVVEIDKLRKILSNIKSKLAGDYNKNPSDGVKYSVQLARWQKHWRNLVAVSDYLEEMSVELAYGKSSRGKIGEAKKTNYKEINKISDQMQLEVLNAPISVLKKAAKDQEIYDEIDWKDSKGAAEEIWDIIFSPMFDGVPDIDDVKRMYKSYFGKPFKGE